MKTNQEIAREIIAEWGYEEEYWWKPIEEALNFKDRQHREEKKKLIDGIPNFNCQGIKNLCEITPHKCSSCIFKKYKQSELEKLKKVI